MIAYPLLHDVTQLSHNNDISQHDMVSVVKKSIGNSMVKGSANWVNYQ